MATAVFDGADAIMLSGESAVGQYPVETIQMMDRIAHDLGWVAMTFTFRGCGRSEGDFSLQGWVDDLHRAIDVLVEETDPLGVWLIGTNTGGSIALCVGAVVCIAAANAGATSQDLKTGYIVGATPIYQQYGLVIGVIVSALIIGYTTLYLHNVMTIGSDALPAPQATLMSTIIKGLLSQNLPWGLVLVGVFVSITLELCGIHSLSFAVGSYLPIATTAPIFAGGLVRWWVERKTGVAQESEVSSGTLFSSGLIAGGSIAGILFAVLVGTGYIAPFQSIGNFIPALHEETAVGQIASALLFLALAVIVSRMAMRKVE